MLSEVQIAEQPSNAPKTTTASTTIASPPPPTHECPDCGKRFKQASNLRTHLKVSILMQRLSYATETVLSN